MSTKIYDAYEYKGNLSQLNEELHKIRKLYFDHCCNILDKETHTLKKFLEYHDKPDSYERQSLVRYSEEHNKAIRDLHYAHLQDILKIIIRKHTWDSLNFEASAVVYPYKKKIFIQFFGLPRDFKLPKKKLKDFHWQNQVDRPKGISFKRYKERENIWDKILERPLCNGVPANAGFIFRFIEEENLFHFCWYYYHTFKGNEVK